MDWLKDNYTTLISNHLVRSAIIIVGSIVIAKITDLVFTGIFKRLTSRTNTELDDKIVNLLHRPIFYSILFVGFSMAVKTATLPEYIDFALVGTFKTGTIIVWLFLISKVFTLSMDWASAQARNRLLQHKTLPLFNNLGKIAIGLFGTYFIFLSWNININGILASAGVLGVILGLAAKDTVANFFAGIFLMADSPFKEGDYILLETGERGYVKSMGLRSTRFMTRDDIEITIPNAVIANSKIINESGGPYEKERVRINISVAYGTDIKKVRQILMDIATSGEDVCKDPDPRVRFREFGDSALLFQLLFWIEKPEMRGRVIDNINGHIYSRFMEENIEIPFPQRTIHVKKTIDE